jgi:PAS domain S-box-containing protein
MSSPLQASLFSLAALAALAFHVLGSRRAQARIRALEDLNEDETRYRMVFEQSSAAMLIFDATLGDVLEANQAAVAFYGWSREELLARRIQELNVLPAEEAVRESEEKFALTFQHAPILMTLSEVETGAYLDVNEAFCRISGYRRAEVLGRTSIELGWVAAEGRSLMKHELQETGRIEGLTLEAVARDGRTVTCILNAELVPIKGHKRLLTAALDVTSLVKAQQQLQHAQKMDSLGNLAGGVAHDMNNVLGAILALASAQVDNHPEGGSAHRAFDTIGKAALRGGEMVKGLLAFSRRSPAEEEQVDLNALLRQEVQLLERTTLAKVRLELDLEGGLHPIRGDASALSHAFMNLCVNAVDAMPGNGTLTLRTRNVEGRWAEVMVEDNGTGMPKAVLDRALEPYFTTKPEGQGTGLGLTLVYSTVKAHRGEMEILSEVGRGTTIRMRFPSTRHLAGPATLATRIQGLPVQGALNVLLVDDDELMQTSIGMMLEMMGHTVTAVGSGEEALASLDDGLQPGVVILDLNMPGLGGVGTLPRLRVLRPGLPIILATGRADQTAMDLVDSNTQVTLLPKPFGLKELRAHLANCGA